MKCHFLSAPLRVAARSLPAVGFICLLLGAGCSGANRSNQPELADRAGRTYYIDGAGNWGFGVKGIRQGLRLAGYPGNVINYRWSATFNPALDQTVGRMAARHRANQLAREISAYLERYPRNRVNIIALSAGSGVAVWACEKLNPPAEVNCLILLGSSLSSHYDTSRALANVSGGIWVYYSPNDPILNGPVRALGTIDGQLIADSAGLVGLHPCGTDDKKIHNIGWSSHWERYGWSGRHTDATNENFVQYELARHILADSPQDATDAPGDAMHAKSNSPEGRPATRPDDEAFVRGQ